MISQIFNLIKDQSTLSWEQIAANILVSGILGFLIFISYMISHRGTIYSKKFNVSLVVLTVLTSMVMTVIGNNVALSLGMVGALSIVRYRTAVKNPLDLMFMFWAIASGIAIFPTSCIGAAMTRFFIKTFCFQFFFWMINNPFFPLPVLSSMQAFSRSAPPTFCAFQKNKTILKLINLFAPI